VRLLLDEHYSPEIARRLRPRDHDVLAVAERADLIGLSDEELFHRMVQEERAIMTNNAKDFVPLTYQAALDGDDHFGLLLTSDRSMPRHSYGIGRVVAVLDEVLRRNPSKDSCRNRVLWVGGTKGRQPGR
jgi:Domain of unknown function (DUF5615)